MNVSFCPKCGFPLVKDRTVKYLKKEYKEMLSGFMRCENCKINYKTPLTLDNEEWKKKTN
ncbi:MAG: hypothetical protein UT24_C0016G0032 [Candidatus Woesebacteria bacterium GW2011_GWB1_39_12]|uniref:Uncharacterized protein n=1 Tax=Candidatus Woesebacteria bacterium GW2011_GWB1_39_12 TaxID=1618574 RepID=A0A0G0MAE7_9BACT|nr:MAG: hypothetical protein UT24_C0016G0032 [Candidatus Woesebacteria bacterium GW2011_GWB1_39_12]